MARTCHRRRFFTDDPRWCTLWEESARFLFRASRAPGRDPGYEICRARFSHTPLKFIPIINSGARALRIPRLCQAAATDKCIAMRTRTYISTYIRLVRETGFPYVLISRRHRRNSVYTDTPSFLTRASLSLSLSREINARPRAFSYPSQRTKYTAIRVARNPWGRYKIGLLRQSFLYSTVSTDSQLSPS